MEHVLISAVEAAQTRWIQAFPQGLLATDVTAITPLGSGDRRILWFDCDEADTSAADEAIANVVACGGLVVVMAANPQESEALQALNKGAMGYCHLLAAPEQLTEISTVIEHGGLWVGPELMQRVLGLAVRVTPPETTVEFALNELTSRELMVAREVGRGASNREIADRLEITERTVKAHLSAIFEKLAVRDRVQLALAVNNISTDTTIN